MDNTEFIAPAVKAIKENLDQIRSLKEGKNELSFAETAQIFLMDKFGYTHIQATEIYDELKQGVEDYTASEEAASNDSSSVADSIVAATLPYSPEERRSIYVNVLTSMQLIKDDKADVEELRNTNSMMSDDELVAAIKDSLDGLPFLFVMEKVKDGLTPELVAIVGETKEIRTKEFKLATALMLYVAQKEGSIKFTDDDSELSPRILGAMAAAGADALAVTADLHEGKVDTPIWRLALKAIVSGLFTVVFTATCTLAILVLNALIINTIFSVFGVGLLATILVLPAIYYFTKNAIKTSETEYAKLIEKYAPALGDIFDVLASWAKAVVEKIKGWMRVARDKVGEVTEKIKTQRPTQTQNADEVVTDPH